LRLKGGVKMTNGIATDPLQQRGNIIQMVQTPLGFFTLVVLIVEVIFGIIATFSQGTDRTYLVVGMICLMFFLVGIVAFLSYKRPGVLTGEPDKIKKLEEQLEEVKKKAKKPLTINLKFDLPVEEAKNLQFKESTVDIYDEGGNIIIPNKNIILSEGGYGEDGAPAWTFQLNDIDDSHRAKVKIIDNKDRVWGRSAFYLYAPYQVTHNVKRG
jgi:hypothetical protein